MEARADAEESSLITVVISECLTQHDKRLYWVRYDQQHNFAIESRFPIRMDHASFEECSGFVLSRTIEQSDRKNVTCQTLQFSKQPIKKLSTQRADLASFFENAYIVNRMKEKNLLSTFKGQHSEEKIQTLAIKVIYCSRKGLSIFTKD